MKTNLWRKIVRFWLRIKWRRMLKKKYDMPGGTIWSTRWRDFLGRIVGGIIARLIDGGVIKK